jgi:hypothetical protein
MQILLYIRLKLKVGLLQYVEIYDNMSVYSLYSYHNISLLIFNSDCSKIHYFANYMQNPNFRYFVNAN